MNHVKNDAEIFLQTAAGKAFCNFLDSEYKRLGLAYVACTFFKISPDIDGKERSRRFILKNYPDPIGREIAMAKQDALKSVMKYLHKQTLVE